MIKFILIRGLPGSGKSTLAKDLCNLYTLADVEAHHYEADQYFEKSGEYKFEREKLSNAHDCCKNMTFLALAKAVKSNLKSIIIVSNTFSTLKEMEPYFQMGKYFNIEPQVILCSGKFKSIHNVPEEAIDRMKSRFEFF